jgi:Pvc16 N-terminal domain
MISDVDGSLTAMLKAEALAGGEAEVVFDAPTTDWSARRSGPAVNVFLYDIREDPARRDIGATVTRDHTGRITGRKAGLRYYRLSYLISAWTKRPEDEHRLLGQLLEMLLEVDRIPPKYLKGRFTQETILLQLAQATGAERSMSELWGALGGELKPSLDLVTIVPMRPKWEYDRGPEVHERKVSVTATDPALTLPDPAVNGMTRGPNGLLIRVRQTPAGQDRPE